MAIGQAVGPHQRAVERGLYMLQVLPLIQSIHGTFKICQGSSELPLAPESTQQHPIQQLHGMDGKKLHSSILSDPAQTTGAITASNAR